MVGISEYLPTTCITMLETFFWSLRKFLTVLSFDETLFISIACPLSSLPRRGGEKRGGSLDSSLVAALPRSVLGGYIACPVGFHSTLFILSASKPEKRRPLAFLDGPLL